MKLILSSLAICRTPLFPIDSNMADVWEELKQCIQEASPDFYGKIGELEFHEQVDPKVRFTLWKYFNRAKSRATPFGQFASFSTFQLCSSKEEPKLLISRQPVLHRFISWVDKEKVKVKGKTGLKLAEALQLNHSIYSCGNELRYIVFVNGRFEIAAIDASPLIIEMIKFCETERSKIALLEFLVHGYSMSVQNAEAFIVHLVDLQILFTDRHPNITGPDYFKRILYKNRKKSADYIISERKVQHSSIGRDQLKVLPELMEFLGNVLPVQSSEPLLNFKRAFLRKFEYKEVPLLIALDPEMGIGYDNLERADIGYSMIDELLPILEHQVAVPQINYTPLHQFLLNKMQNGGVIHLEEYPREDVETKHTFPNTLSILFEISDGKIILEGGGGVTSNALNGRFTFASDVLEQDGMSLAKIEQDANPNVLFFDIAYHAERQVDNINRRKSVYPFELPVLTWSCTEKPLAFSDILISIQHDEIVLRSKSHNLRMVPRIASAYNYSRSDLSVYRFLCDLQHQGIKGRFDFRLKRYFPDLDRYPRVQYKDVVISPAAWLVPDQLYKEKDVALNLEQLKLWLSQIGMKDCFNAGQNDQLLCFNPEEDQDLMAFLQYCKSGKGAVYIHEAFVPKAGIVRDENGGTFKSEFVVNLFHHENIYRPVSENNLVYNPSPQSLKMPGEWLYFEIYSRKERQDQILLNVIAPYLKDISKKLSSWFFIRYNDPAAHLRLRIQLKPGVSSDALSEKMALLLSDDLLTGLVSDFKIKLYRQEVERYGLDHITAAERCFRADSWYALKLLRSGKSEEVKYMRILRFIEEVMNGCNWRLSDQAIVARSMADNFAKEMKLKVQGYRFINKSYEALMAINNFKDRDRELEKRRLLVVTEFCSTIMSCRADDQVAMFTDLIHMHVNRLFPSDQRVHEMVIYQYLMKKLKGKENGKAI